MARMITHAILLVLFTCQMLSGEGRQIGSLGGRRNIKVKSPSHRSIRKLSSQIHTFDLSEKSPIQTQKTSAEYPQDEIQNRFPSLKSTHRTPRSSHKVDSFWANKVDSTVKSNCLGEKCPDDFKPTAPGHSPGAGHSFVTNTDKISPNQQTENPKIWNSHEVSEHDFRHTTPGRSPIVGHAENDKRDLNLRTAEAETFSPSPASPSSFFSDSALVSTNDFRPTDPGTSPGAGHLDTNKIDIKNRILSK